MITLHHVEKTRSLRTLWLLHELEWPFEVSIHAFDKSFGVPGVIWQFTGWARPPRSRSRERMFETRALPNTLRTVQPRPFGS